MSIVRRTLASPIVAGALLYVLTRGPASAREQLMKVLRTEANADRFAVALKVILGLKAVGMVNGFLNYLSENRHAPKWDWKKEVAVVTGGANGIGAGVVKQLASKGVMCIVLDVAELPKDMQNYANIRHYTVDLTDQKAVTEVAERIKTRHGHPTILHNNAGIATPGTILNTKPHDLQKTFAVNVFASYYTVQAFLPGMLERNKGHIITTASLSSFVPPANLVAYGSTKAAIMSFHEGLTAEIRNSYNGGKQRGVQTSIVHPTYVKTRLVGDFASLIESQGGVVVETQDVVDAIVKRILSGKGGRVIVPHNLSIGRYVRALPNWLQNAVRDSASKHLLGSEDGFPEGHVLKPAAS